MSYPRRPSMLARIGIKGDRDGPETDLDDEMEKVFATVETERFDFSRISSSEAIPDSDHRRYDERDFSFHRQKNYPHIHTPLRRSIRKRVSISGKSKEAKVPPADSEEESDSVFPEENNSNPATSSDVETSALRLSGLSLHRPSCLAGHSSDNMDHDSEPSSDRRVQFHIDGVNENDKDTPRQKRDSMDISQNKVMRKRRNSRKYSMPEYPVWRKKSGAFLPYEERKLSIQASELVTLKEADQDNLTSHRFDVNKDKRRFSVRSRVSQVSLVGSSRNNSVIAHPMSPVHPKKSIDHSPRKIFVQLNELIGFGEDREWKETARWIKYEENIEEGAERWGKPHVPTLSFHALLNLRRCLETGVIMLELEEKGLPGIVYRVVEQMVIEELILSEDKSSVMRALLLRHKHVVSSGNDRFRFSIRRNTVTYTSLQNLQDEVKSRPKLSVTSPSLFSNSSTILEFDTNKVNNNHTSVEMKEETYTPSTAEDLMRKAAKESILKKIPEGAEGAAVLVGAVDFLEQPTTAFVRLAEGTVLPTVTEVPIPVRFLFILLGPLNAELDYHEVGRSISTLLSNADFQSVAYRASDRRELLSAINEILDFSIVMPPGDYEKQALLPSHTDIQEKTAEIRRRQSRMFPPTQPPLPPASEKKPKHPNPLKQTGKLFGGLVNDVKRRFPFYMSDFLDGLNGQCIAAAIFIYFAALSAAITFGGLMADKTDQLIGISETLISTSLAGVIFALLSGQPLIIVGTTGPLLLFDESLYKFCDENKIDYLSIRVHIGFWLFLIALVVCCFEGSVLVKLFTRFISEIFATLISLLYIMESAMKIFALFYKHPLLQLFEYCLGEPEENVTLSAVPTTDMSTLSFSNFTSSSTESLTTDEPILLPTAVINQPNTALFCTVLALGTFFIAYYLRHFRNSKFLGRSVRRALGDFGVPIAIVLMVALDYLEPGTYTEKLKVPEGLSPTNPSVRGWVISPLGLLEPVPLWVACAAVIPAMLVYILLFMETHISELIIDKKERKLKKGCGFHMDILLICLTNVFCALIGAPFISAATVRSVAHVSSLTVMSSTHAPGDKPFIIEVKEQRLSALIVSLLVGFSVLVSPLLRLVPMAVLFGVFLYLGISSIDGIQFLERVRLFFMPIKHHPQVNYVRRVQTMKMHLFTTIQLLCLGGLWIVKSSSLALALPFFLILLVPLRANLCYLFTPLELSALDSDEPDQVNQESEPDFYAESILAG